MAIKTKDLIKKLLEKDQEAEVEFIVMTQKGELVCMDVEASVTDLMHALKVFGGVV